APRGGRHPPRRRRGAPRRRDRTERRQRVSDAPEPIDSSITPLISTLTFGGRIFGRAMSRITVDGAIDEIPTEGPLILAANHASNLDAVVLGSWLIPRLGRRIHLLRHSETFSRP